MHTRSHAGWKLLLLATSVASLILLPSLGATASELEPLIKQPKSNGGLAPSTDDPEAFQGPTLFPRANYSWPFASGPFYGKVDASRTREAGVLHTSVGSFELAGGQLNIPAELSTGNLLGVQPVQYFVVQVDRDAMQAGDLDNLRATIDALGGAIVREMAIASFVVRMNQAVMSAVQGHNGVIAVEPFHAAFKLNPNIGRVPLPDPYMAVSEVYRLNVRLHPGEDAGVVAQILADMGGTVLTVFDDAVRVDIHRSHLPQIARLESVFTIDEFVPNFTKGEETTNVMQTGSYCPSGGCAPIPFHVAGVNGSTQILMVLDSGIQVDNGDLSDTHTTAGTPGTDHRKVIVNESTSLFSGTGDTLGCDDEANGAFTHGHTVSATALGNATDVDPVEYGAGWLAEDDNQTMWRLDGVAPKARLVNYDGQVTPNNISCSDPAASGISPGNVQQALQAGYGHGARVSNFSWGTTDNNTYGNANSIDTFLATTDGRNAMVFVSAGNEGRDLDLDGYPDESSVSDPATCKNCIVMGGSLNAADQGTASGNNQEDRYGASSVGPVIGDRIAPILMAPGDDQGGMGMDSEYSCRGSDNLQDSAVECNISSGVSGTSFSSPAGAGAALLVRDYFAKGFYPDGTDGNPGNAAEQTDISGAMVKAALIASADWMDGGNSPTNYRFNNEQGYGRIQLDQVLPLQSWSEGVVGLIVADGGIDTGPNNFSGLSGSISLAETQTTTFKLCDTSQPLSVALAWIEGAGETLINDLDLELEAQSGDIYWGNYFTDDNDRSRVQEAGEDCAGFDGTTGEIDNHPWSLPVCGNSIRDTANPTEAIFLSTDPDGDGIEDDGLSQIETGTYTLRIIGRSGTFSEPQRYALAVAGGVCLTSSVRLDRATYVCSDTATITVNELDDPANDPEAGLTVGEISGRVTVEVWYPGNETTTPDDVETGITFTQPDPAALQFVSSDLILTDGTLPDPGNGALDVAEGSTIKVIYADEALGVPTGDLERFNIGKVDCSAAIGFGNLVFGQFGLDTITNVDGGCERNARGGFEFGYPDKYMDKGEAIDYGFAFFNNETSDLRQAEATLRCVVADADSPASCRPNTADCADPNRLNNTDCTGILTITDPWQILGDIPAGAAIAAHFGVYVEPTLTGTHKIEMILGISSPVSSKPIEGLAIARHRVNVDEASTYYSTDFPGGDTEIRDYNNNEVLDAVTTNLGIFALDYRFEQITWSDLTDGGQVNTNLDSPWNFDTNDGGFMVGIGATTDADRIFDTIAQWGEDKNFDGVLDPGEDRDPTGGALPDTAWSQGGGCGWMTRDGDNRGAWHTGRSYSYLNAGCMVSGSATGKCQEFERILLTTAGEKSWFELLLTPVVQQVGFGDDADGDPIYTLEHMNWAWNSQIDLPDQFVLYTWEFDTDTTDPEPVGLKNDGFVFNLAGGAFTPNGTPFPAGNPGLATPSVYGGLSAYPLFRDPDSTGHQSGLNNQDGDSSCYFTTSSVSNFADIAEPYPLDDDCDNESYCSLNDIIPCNGTTCIFACTGVCVNNPDPDNPNYCSNYPDIACVTAGSTTECDFGVCLGGDGDIDEFVRANGPIRNSDLTIWNGIDMRFQTLEDFYGPSGESFQGAIGYFVAEGTSSITPAAGYGIAIDDMVMEWREYTLDEDPGHCAGGECAALTLQSTNFFDGNALVTITAIDKTPTCASEGCDSGANHYNDCDLDGDYLDDGSTDDCDGDGTPDIVVEAYNDLATDREIVFLNQTGAAGGAEFKGVLTISSAYDVDGTLYLERLGTDAPFINVDYWDNNDGTNNICNNDPDPAARGLVQAFTQVLFDVGAMTVKSARLVDNGDGDNFADTKETVEMYLTLQNSSGIDLHNVILRASSNDPKISCITKPLAVMGDYLDNESREGDAAVIFMVSPDANRTNPLEDYSAEFKFTISADEFDALFAPETMNLSLDLNVSGGGTPSTFIEDFEDLGGGFGQFTSMALDDGHINNNAASDPYRCSYNDPDWVNSNSYQESDCYLGPNAFGWHIHSTADPDGGRSFTQQSSLHWGSHASSPDTDTHHIGQLEAVATTNPIHIGYAPGTAPELTYKQQVSFLDWRGTNTPVGETPIRAVVMLQIEGDPTGNWIKLKPYWNAYDSQGTDFFVDCLFDPVDDGNDEDSFFDPGDPNRRLGPSSTCFPEFAFSWIGDTDYRAPADPNALGGAAQGPGLAGNTGGGTWIESKFNLSSFAGQSVNLRFLVTAIEVDGTATVADLFTMDPGDPVDDGWYIDDVQVSDTLTSAATVAADGTDNSALPDSCATNCTLVTADLEAEPTSSPAPGHLVRLSAALSTADACISGTLYYRFSANGTLVRDWTDNAVLYDAPAISTDYLVEVKCSSAPECVGSTTLPFTVDCPSTGTLGAPFGQMVTMAADKDTLQWSLSSTVSAVQGDLGGLRTTGIYNNTVNACIADNVTGTSISDTSADPAADSGYYYLVKGATAGACNAAGLWGDTAGSGPDDATNGVDQDVDTCP